MSLNVILASSSPYRRAILTNLGLDVTTVCPNIDETPHKNEAPSNLVKRLAVAKSKTVNASKQFIIACDQVAEHNGQILGKPHTMDNAYQQLSAFNAQSVTFYTGIALRYQQQTHALVDTFTVHFRSLSDDTIRHYLAKERPLDCAGSFKSEGLGILLFKALEGRDPNALIGLPVIALNELFELYGVNLLTST